LEDLAAVPRPTPAPPVVRAWPDTPVVHGFAGRQGGVSTGPFATLNVSYEVGDEREHVDENWRRIRALIGRTSRVVRLKQVHGAVVHTAGVGDGASTEPRGDGLVTGESGVVLAVLTADCVPILMFDHKRRIAGALHAGWRGILAGIVAAGMGVMEKLGADPARVRAALGPSIGPCCFEVDAELAARFEREIRGSGRHRRPGRPGKAYLDLRAIVSDQLVGAGVRAEAITTAGPCTRCAGKRYFSRRAAAGAITGLQLSFIGFRATSGEASL
jgi:purine-nucleoside/S-methyl-5'-thioadenosine phosphorylase / adenosine deaminase